MDVQTLQNKLLQKVWGREGIQENISKGTLLRKLPARVDSKLLQKVWGREGIQENISKGTLLRKLPARVDR